MELLDFKNRESDWLDDAIPLDAYRSKDRRLRRLVNRLFDEIAPLIGVSSRHRQKEALKTALINLFQAHRIDKPVRYSRDRSRYTRDRRYGMLHLKYDRLIPIIDALQKLGYIEQRHGFFYRDDEQGKQTRMWGTDRLWALFSEHQLSQPVFFIAEPAGGREGIILRNEDKQAIGYRETRQTRRMREDLERYNAFVRRHRVSLRLQSDTIVDNRFLVEELYRLIHSGKVWIRDVRFTPDSPLKRTLPIAIPNFTGHLKKYNYNPARILNNIIDSSPDPISITQMKWREPLTRETLRRLLSDENRLQRDLAGRYEDIHCLPFRERQEVLAQEFALRDIGVESLEIVLDEEQVHRVFNRKSWKYGGRAYGALHQDWVRKEMRPHIEIDGEPTTEIDYSAFHILMLYHRKGIDYRRDPYEVCEGPEMREIYKSVGLIAINAKDERTAYGALRQELKDRGLPLPQREEPLKSLVQRFREAHQPISEYLYSDVGIELQNIDSHIMNAILVSLLDHGVLGLSVHDSVIVQRQHEDLLRTTMVEEYRRVMGFEPRI